MNVSRALPAILLLTLAPIAFADPAPSKIGLWEQPGLCGANVYQEEVRFDSPRIGVDWYPPLDAQDLQDLRSAGANVVALSVPGPYNVRHPYGPDWASLRRLKHLVDAAESAGLWTVIACRTGPGRSEEDITDLDSSWRVRSVYDPGKTQDEYVKMWQHLARTYKDRPHVIGYDLMVEPHAVDKKSADDFRDQWRILAQRLINAIRPIDPDTPILVCPDNWGHAVALKTWTPLNGDNLVYTVHQYAPYNFTHEDSTDLNEALQELDTAYAYISDWRKCHPGQRVAVTEYGMKYKKAGALEFMKRQFDLLETHGLNHLIWLWEVRGDDCCPVGLNIRCVDSIREEIYRRWSTNQNFYSP